MDVPNNDKKDTVLKQIGVLCFNGSGETFGEGSFLELSWEKRGSKRLHGFLENMFISLFKLRKMSSKKTTNSSEIQLFMETCSILTS